MRKFIVYFLTICIPAILIVSSVNLLITPDEIYKCGYMDRIIEMARKGYNATNAEPHLDERLFKKKYAELYKNREIDYLILGASRLMPISSEAINGNSVLNLALSGAKIEDLISIYQVSKANHIKPSNVIIGIDPLFFNPNYSRDWWQTISEYYYQFMGVEDFKNYNRPWDRLFSIDYFKKVINSFHDSADLDLHSVRYTKEIVNDGYTRRKDGSIYYPKNFREKSLDEVNDIAKSFIVDEYEFDTLSTERIRIIEKLIDRIQMENCNIVILCCPFHPLLFQRIMQRDCVKNTISYVSDLANRKNLVVIGHYNPTIEGFDEKDFYDATHVKKESLDFMLQQHRDLFPLW